MIKSLLTLGLTSSMLCISALAADNGNSTSKDPVILDIDGTKITLGEFERKQPNVLFQARNNFYQAERKAADSFVDQYLLERQAKKENVTVDELLEKHVNHSIGPDPSDDAVRLFYELAKATQPFETVKAQMLDHVRQLRIEKAKADYIKTLRDAAAIEIVLEAPRAPMSMKDTPVRGVAGSPVSIVEFADFECPYCQQVQPTLEKLEADYKGKVTFAYKDAPLPMHPHAEKAAEAAHCAGMQGKYWEYHDGLFQSKKLDLPQLKDAARTLKLDGDAFDKCLDSGDEAALVKEQLGEAQNYQIQGTPSFFINGRFFEGVLTYDQFRTAIDDELAKVSSRPLDTAKR